MWPDILHVPASILTDDLLNEIEIHALPKGSFLIRQGEPQVYVSFLIDGIIPRIFFWTPTARRSLTVLPSVPEACHARPDITVPSPSASRP